MLGVSRTPLREALGLLERDGLVQNFPNRGWFVTKFTPAEIRDIFFIRSGLENMAADLIIDRLTEAEFAELASRIEEQGGPYTVKRKSNDRSEHEESIRAATKRRSQTRTGDLSCTANARS